MMSEGLLQKIKDIFKNYSGKGVEKSVLAVVAEWQKQLQKHVNELNVDSPFLLKEWKEKLRRLLK